MERIDNADITTIHGFCRRTLIREPFESDSGIDLVIEGEPKQLAQEIINDYWQKNIFITILIIYFYFGYKLSK